MWCTVDARGNETCDIPHRPWTLPVHKHGRCTQSSARLLQPWSCTPHQPPCGTSDMNTWCHKCLHHNMHTLPPQEKTGFREGVAREDDGGGAADAPELDAGFFMVKDQPSRVPSVLAARITWVWAKFVNDPPSGDCNYQRAAEALLKCIRSAPSGATGPGWRIHTSPPIPRCEIGKEGLRGEQTRRREMIIVPGEWRNIETTEV